MGFGDFFFQATQTKPFPYQEAFATAENLPDILEVPTGAGKTATAILGWLWRRRYGPPEIRAATSRRLVFCLPMRTLVEQTLRVTRGWLETSGDTDQVGLYGLLGGAVEQQWEEHPERDAILVGTQDQLLSRALNRGYGMSRFRWPVHFALLNNDCLWILDEVQLMGAGLSTSTQLQALRERWGTLGKSHSVWMSATLQAGKLGTIDFRHKKLTRLGLTSADRDHPLLSRRLTAKKLLQRASTKYKGDVKTYAAALAQEVAAAHAPGSLTLVVLNRVARAQEVFAQLRKKLPNVPVQPLHSRFRLKERKERQEEVLQPGWQGVLISTQAIEAGVDISSKTMFTELAPWSSLVQRFGRCNRKGELPEGEARIFWIDLENEKNPEDAALPYTPEALEEARGVLPKLEDAGPKRLAEIPLAEAAPESPVLRQRDLRDLFDTTPDLAGHDLDVSRYIRDSRNLDVQVAWREWENKKAGSAKISAPPAQIPNLHQNELCSVPIGAIKKFLNKSSAFRWDSLAGTWENIAPPQIVPGMTLLLPLKAGGYSSELGWTGNPKNIPDLVTHPDIEPDFDESEHLSYGCGDYVTLETHSSDVFGVLNQLRLALEKELDTNLPWDELLCAARWHDLGKAHEVFQEMLLAGLPENDERRTQGPWAKSDGKHRTRSSRRHFRHELASALALLAHGESDLAAYLAAAHHGKVRLAIRSRPTEKAPPEEKGVSIKRFALGIWEGPDKLPAVSLGDGVSVPATVLRLDVMEMGEQNGQKSWLARTLGLLEQYGIFRLGLLETLVRVADWRGSRLRQTKDAQGGNHD